MSDIIVHGVPGSPYLRAALLGCLEKGIHYRLQRMPMEAMRSAQHLALHPFAKIPIIEHGGFTLYETQAILRYVDDAFAGPALTPDTPQARARMNQAMGIADCYVFPSVSQGIVWNRILAPQLGWPGDEGAVQAALPQAQVCVRTLDALLGTQPFLAGARLSLADLLLAPHLDFFLGVPEGQEMLQSTRLGTWLERMRALRSMQVTTWNQLSTAA